MLQAFVSPRQVCVGAWVDLEEPGVAPPELRVDSLSGSSEIRDLPHGEPVHFLVSQAEKHALQGLTRYDLCLRATPPERIPVSARRPAARALHVATSR